MRDEFENRFNEWKTQYMAEKNDYKFKCEDLETKLTRANSKLAEVQKFHEKVKYIIINNIISSISLNSNSSKEKETISEFFQVTQDQSRGAERQGQRTKNKRNL